MKAEQILEGLKLAFTALTEPAPAPTPEPTPAPVALMKAVLKDGTEVEVDKLEIGGVVTIAGNPAPVGEHYLEDGTEIVLGDNGVIMEIKAPMAEPAPAAPVMEDMTAKFAAIEAKYNQVVDKQIAVTNLLNDVLKFVEALAKQPQSQPDPEVKTVHKFSVDENFANAIVSKK